MHLIEPFEFVAAAVAAAAYADDVVVNLLLQLFIVAYYELWSRRKQLLNMHLNMELITYSYISEVAVCLIISYGHINKLDCLQ